MGGKRGVIEVGQPPVTFAVTNAVASAQVGTRDRLSIAITAAAATAVALTIAAVAQRRPLRQALVGLAGVTVAAGYAA